jgi:hypothetical protein
LPPPVTRGGAPSSNPFPSTKGMNVLKSTRIALAVSGSLLASTAAFSPVALAAEEDAATSARPEELKKQIEALQRSISTLQKQVESLQKRSDAAAPASPSAALVTQADLDGFRSDFENYKYDRERERERETAKTARDTTVFGTVQVRYQAQDEKTSAGNPAPTSDRYNTFDVPTALIGFRGNLYRDYVEGKNLEYQVSLSYAKRAGSAGSTADFNLQDAFVRYNFLPTIDGLEGDRLTVTVGQQLLPFGIEAQAAEDLRPTINVATAPAQLGLFNRQIGAVFRGDFEPYVDYAANYRAPLFEYALGVVDGNYSNKLDDNNGKAVVARVAFTLPVDYASWLRELKLGASLYKGSRPVANASGITLDGDGRKDIYGFDIYYNHAPYGATYEYWEGRTAYATTDNLSTDKARSVGHTLTLFYTFGDQFFNSIKTAAKFDDFWPQSIQSYYRFDYYNPNTRQDLSGVKGHGFDTVRVHTLGFNWFFAQTTKLQVGVNHYDYKNETASRKDYNEFQAQLQYTF